MRLFFKIVIAFAIISIISVALHTILQTLPSNFALAYQLYVMIVILGISMFLAGSITEPLERLKKGFNSLLEGRYVQVKIDTGDELEDLGKFFNTVAKELILREKILRETEEKYRNLVENLNDWIFETDKNLNILFSNKKGYEIFGENLIGRNLRDFLLEFPVDCYNFETTLINGKIFEFNLNPLYKDGELIGFIGIGRDITEKKKAEQRTAYLAAITEHTIDAIISLDIDGRIVSWNRGAEIMLGYKAEEMIGKSFLTIVPEEFHDSCREDFKRAILHSYSKDIEAKRITKDGRTIIVDQTLTSIYDSNGEITGFVVIMRDITEKKKNEEKLKKAYEELKKKTLELEYLANIVENSNDAIYSIDLNGVITSWNKAAEKLFGWRKDEAIGMHISELLSNKRNNEIEYILERIKSGTENLSFEEIMKRKDGSLVDVEVTLSPIFDEDKNLSGISIIARDISHKVRAENELIKKVLKYKVEIGKTYITDNFDLALDVLEDMVKIGFNGTIITRRLPDEIKTNSNCRIFWLSEKNGNRAIQPKPEAIEKTIFNLPNRNNVVVIELDYLLTKLDFKTILKMIQNIRDDFYILKRGVVIFVLNFKVLDEKQISILKMECYNLKKKDIKISHELYELLRFVYMKNKTGEKPSIKDVMDELGLSRNTVKKRIKQLKDKGLLNVVKYGRTKLLEVTEEGKTLF